MKKIIRRLGWWLIDDEIKELAKRCVTLSLENDDLKRRLHSERQDHGNTRRNLDKLSNFVRSMPPTVVIKHNDVSKVRV